ncbi:DUF7832 domain-containing protein [Neisseria chenwenguii]|uniref:Cell surface protein n=1 Tax=Neisseria chenwenguii TaxID=1853278 RepID=A0A220S2L9_9NEIS|nr:cell surface protein [Neisseria chenwenguii]ASK27626.1 cell surface protein [Neisseria chenwenguii]ROV54444.1 cell surface protein [Neisseria chenwenguii]
MYDYIQFHTDENYPENLPPENAATHMGMYWQWAALQGLANPVWQTAPETAADFAAMQAGRMSGAQFLLKHMGGALTPEDFTEWGQRFTEFYYDDEEDGYGAFMEDYVKTLNTPALGGFYCAADTPETYAALAPVFQTAYLNWKRTLK